MGQSEEELFSAIVRDDLEAIRAIVTFDRTLSHRMFEGNTSLHVAAANSHDPQVLTILLTDASAINDKNDKGRTPLHIACDADNRIMIRALLKQGADRLVADSEGQLPRIPADILRPGDHRSR